MSFDFGASILSGFLAVPQTQSRANSDSVAKDDEWTGQLNMPVRGGVQEP